jgi:hypothetical protein
LRFAVFIAELSLPCPRTLTFPPFGAANLIRGQFGKQLFHRQPELYRLLFVPDRRNSGPSGLADPPRPYVLRTRHLDGHSFQQGQFLPFRIHLFSSSLTSYFDSIQLVECDLEVRTKQTQVRLEFLSPTEIRGQTLPAFGPLFARLRDRLSTLASLYQNEPIRADFRALGAQANAIQLLSHHLEHHQFARHRHQLRGYTGQADYAGELSPFLPWLAAAEYTGVGRHTVWGQGEIRISQESRATLAD